MSNDNLENELNQLQKEMELYKNNVDEFFDSTNFLLKSLFLDHETNKPKKLLDDLQNLSLELLVFVDNICKKHDLNWWLDFGNLLGAVRHGGYIPWDDDIDIGMMRNDYMKFDEIISSEIKHYNLNDIIDVGYHNFRPGIPKFVQLYVKHTTAISKDRRVVLGNVDVFPYEYIRDYNKETIFEEYLAAKDRYLFHRKYDYNTRFCFDTYYESLNMSWEPADYIIPGWENPCTPKDMYKLYVIETNKIFPLKKIKFENQIFPCPNDTDSYLKKLYSDYMNIPKSLRKHDNLSSFSYNTNNDEIFEKCINRIKEVNESFHY